jgi:hypothetical protein
MSRRISWGRGKEEGEVGEESNSSSTQTNIGTNKTDIHICLQTTNNLMSRKSLIINVITYY